MRTIESYIDEHALSNPSKIAIVCNDERVTYAQLKSRIDANADRLLKAGIKKGMAIPLVASPSIDYLVAYFSVHQIGCVAVPLSEDAPEDFKNRLQTLFQNLVLPDACADVLYTTGTTGVPKGVIISHKAIIADAENLIYAQQYSSDQVFLICGPLNHAGCWSKVFPVIMLGGTLYLLPGMKDLNLFFEALEYDSTKIASFLVPASISILLQFDSERLASYSHKIDFIETGAAPISEAVMRRLCEILPDTRLYNTYASTETGIIATHNFNQEHGCVAGCLGKAMPHSSITISDEGLVVCHGDTLMWGYMDDYLAFHTSFAEDCLSTSDMGILDEDGCLHLMGRKDDVINVGGYKVNPLEVEKVALEIPGIEECICLSSPHPLAGNVLKLKYVVGEHTELSKKAIARYISTRLEKYKVPMFYEQVEYLNKTYNGKLDRKSYK